MRDYVLVCAIMFYCFYVFQLYSLHSPVIIKVLSHLILWV